MIEYSRLKEYLRYDPLTGVFTWIKKKTKGSVKVGDVAGCPHGNGYWDIRIDRRLYFAHRLAWFYMTGKWPNGHIDHKNGDPGDNRWENLREATASQNHANTRRPKNNTSGLKGASYAKANNRWLAQIRKQGRHVYLGYHDTKEEAHAAYLEASRRLNGEFARAG